MFLLDEESGIKTGPQHWELAREFAFESFQPLQKRVYKESCHTQINVRYDNDYIYFETRSKGVNIL